jgi:hypothetical protein
LARELRNPAFVILPSRLHDIETKKITPSIHRLYTLACNSTSTMGTNRRIYRDYGHLGHDPDAHDYGDADGEVIELEVAGGEAKL